MDIRTKLALALVSVSLLSMLVLGTFAYQTAFELLRQVSERQLDALAESKQRDLEKVVEGWRERVQLIRSRTRLRTLLARSVDERDAESIAEITRILEDAIASVRHVDRVTLFDDAGRLVASVGTAEVPAQLNPAIFAERDAVIYGGATILPDDRVFVRFDASLQRDGETIGAIEVIIDAEDLLSVTNDYTGLGDSGESVVVMPAPERADQSIVLTELRHDDQLRRLDLKSTPCMAAALAGDEAVHRSGMHDYRSADVWCATRAVAEVGWGLVVKIDSAEERVRADWLRTQMIDLGLALGAFAILGGTLLGMQLGRPLRTLAEVVKRIRAGERDLRADDSAPDEIGFLAEAVNDLLDEHDRS